MPEAPPQTPKSPNHPTNIVRNILVGAITTIIGSTVVYFITNKNKPSEMEIMLMTKDATINGWKSYVTFENVYTKKSLSLMNEYVAKTINLEEFVAETKKESDKFKKSIEELKTKRNIDKDFVQALDSRLENEKVTVPFLEKYTGFIHSIQDTSLTVAQQNAVQAEIVKWGAQNKGYVERAITDIEDIAKTLSIRYGQTFSMNDFLVYTMYLKTTDSTASPKVTPAPSDAGTEIVREDTLANIPEVPPTTKLLTGRWLANPPNGADIDLAKTGKFFWHVASNGDHISGTWKLAGTKLNLYPVNEETKKKGQWIFELSQVRPNTFTMKLTVEPHNGYNMVRQQ